MEKSKFDISKLSAESLAKPASYPTCMRIAYHFVPEVSGKRDWKLWHQVKAHYAKAASKGKLTVLGANKLLQLKRLPIKTKRDIEAYIANQG